MASCKVNITRSQWTHPLKFVQCSSNVMTQVAGLENIDAIRALLLGRLPRGLIIDGDTASRVAGESTPLRQPGKAMVKVERFGRRGNGVNDNESCREFSGSAERTAKNIGKHGPAQPLSLPSKIDCQPSENNHRNDAWHVPAHGADNVLCQNLPHTDGIVADDLPRTRRTYDIGSAGSCLQVVPGAVPQPVIQLRARSAFSRRPPRSPHRVEESKHRATTNRDVPAHGRSAAWQQRAAQPPQHKPRLGCRRDHRNWRGLWLLSRS